MLGVRGIFSLAPAPPFATRGVAIEDQRFADLRSKTSLADHIIRPGIAVLSRVSRHFPAVHMTFGAINEISALTGYQALIARTDFARDRSDSQSPLLTAILERIIKDERRHFAFYFNQACAGFAHALRNG